MGRRSAYRIKVKVKLFGLMPLQCWPQSLVNQFCKNFESNFKYSNRRKQIATLWQHSKDSVTPTRVKATNCKHIVNTASKIHSKAERQSPLTNQEGCGGRRLGSAGSGGSCATISCGGKAACPIEPHPKAPSHLQWLWCAENQCVRHVGCWGLPVGCWWWPVHRLRGTLWLLRV